MLNKYNQSTKPQNKVKIFYINHYTSQVKNYYNFKIQISKFSNNPKKKNKLSIFLSNKQKKQNNYFLFLPFPLLFSLFIFSLLAGVIIGTIVNCIPCGITGKPVNPFVPVALPPTKVLVGGN